MVLPTWLSYIWHPAKSLANPCLFLCQGIQSCGAFYQQPTCQSITSFWLSVKSLRYELQPRTHPECIREIPLLLLLSYCHTRYLWRVLN